MTHEQLREKFECNFCKDEYGVFFILSVNYCDDDFYVLEWVDEDACKIMQDAFHIDYLLNVEVIA